MDLFVDGHNIQESFDSFFRCEEFQCYSDFKAKLPDFFSLNNVKYKVSRCTPLAPDARQKQTLQYRYMKFVCCARNCPSYFVLSKKHDILRISKYFMSHSHSLQPSNCKSRLTAIHYSRCRYGRFNGVFLGILQKTRVFFICGCHGDSRPPPAGDLFTYELYHIVQATGQSFVTGNSQKLKPDDPYVPEIMYKRIVLVCNVNESAYSKVSRSGRLWDSGPFRHRLSCKHYPSCQQGLTACFWLQHEAQPLLWNGGSDVLETPARCQ